MLAVKVSKTAYKKMRRKIFLSYQQFGIDLNAFSVCVDSVCDFIDFKI
jgi:hypothetical protein